jgi:hypothetical protein
MLKVFKSFSALSLCLLVGCIEERIDLERDVPNRAKALAREHADAVREVKEDPVARETYQTLAQLQKQKKDVEIRIAALNGGAICPICRKKFNVPAQKAILVKRAKKKGAPSSRSKKSTRKTLPAPKTTPVTSPPPVIPGQPVQGTTFGDQTAPAPQMYYEQPQAMPPQIVQPQMYYEQPQAMSPQIVQPQMMPQMGFAQTPYQ